MSNHGYTGRYDPYAQHEAELGGWVPASQQSYQPMQYGYGSYQPVYGYPPQYHSSHQPGMYHNPYASSHRRDSNAQRHERSLSPRRTAPASRRRPSHSQTNQPPRRRSSSVRSIFGGLLGSSRRPVEVSDDEASARTGGRTAQVPVDRNQIHRERMANDPEYVEHKRKRDRDNRRNKYAQDEVFRAGINAYDREYHKDRKARDPEYAERKRRQGREYYARRKEREKASKAS